MHLLIILLQQLLGMLPSSKQVPQPEVVRNGGSPNGGEPDACGSIVAPLYGWMTPFKRLHLVAQPILSAATPPRAATETPPRLLETSPAISLIDGNPIHGRADRPGGV